VTYNGGMMYPVGVQRQIIKASASKHGVGALKKVAEKYGMKEYVVAGRLLDWFGQQDDIFQREVLGLLEGLEAGAVTAYVLRLTEKLRGDELKGIGFHVAKDGTITLRPTPHPDR
jgi:hypothetical protein